MAKVKDSYSFTVLDIGANGGFKEFISLQPQINYHGFEPDVDAFDLLQKKYQKNLFSKCTLYQKALGDKVAEVDFYSTENNEMSSVLKPNVAPLIKSYGEQGKEWAKSLGVKKQYTVSQTTIDELFNNIPNFYVDYLKLDVQGTEFEVLKGAEKLIDKGRVGIIKTEVSFVSMYEKQKPHNELSDFLREKNYGFISATMPASGRDISRLSIYDLIEQGPVVDSIYVYDKIKSSNLIKTAILLLGFGNMAANEKANELLVMSGISWKEKTDLVRRYRPPVDILSKLKNKIKRGLT